MVIGICGAGTMGASIAQACLQAGLSVVLYDAYDTARAKAERFIRETLEKAVSKGIMSASAQKQALEKLLITDTLDSLRTCGIVIEAIIEQADIKRSLYEALEGIVPLETLIASNTSSISITALAASMRYPERFAGLHFFNPAHIMKLVEVISGMKTAPATISALTTFAETLGKTPVEAKDVPGFIVNRVARNYYLEAMRIAMEGGATIPQIDGLMRSVGFKMGPFELVDLIGVDVNFAVTMSVWEQYFREPRFAPALLQKEYVDAGLWGKKSGEGFYRYNDKGEKILPDETP
ncbi:MAG: 3-hydroxyacyl-CoA dehydrogenase NAD-binding domain-containing protein [Candidatus Kapaibacteriota bacterium]